MSDFQDYMDDIHRQIASAIGIPARMLTASIARRSVDDAQQFYEQHRQMLRAIKTRMRISYLETTNRERKWIEGNLYDNHELKTYIRPSRGFAIHNRRTKQETRRP